MKVWLITVGEPLPNDPGGPRLLRTGIVAEILLAQGHTVTWWSSTVNHSFKTLRAAANTAVVFSNAFKLILLHGIPYKTNISIARLINHFMMGREFRKLVKFEDRPDVILCSFPTIELSLHAAEYGIENGVPVILDIRDLWPDIFLQLLPRGFRWFGRILLATSFSETKRACRSATAIVGITEEFVAWGARKAGRQVRGLDKAFPLAYTQVAPSEQEQQEARTRLRQLGVRFDAFIVCFIGTIGRQFDLETVIAAARQLRGESDIQFVLCGNGPRIDHYRKLAHGLDNVLFTGWLGKAEIWVLMRLASLGLSPYFSEHSFTLSIPNKAVEYMSAALPQLTSLDGVLRQLVSDNDCGRYYPNGDHETLAKLLKNLRDDRAVRKALSDNAHSLYLRKFRAEAVYRGMAELISSIAAKSTNSLQGHIIDG